MSSLYIQLRKLLSDAGLSEMEAALYISILHTPAATTWELVERTGFSKSSVYRAIDNLNVLRMVTIDETGVHALSLTSLVAQLNTSVRSLRKTASKIKSLAPYLRMPRDSIDSMEMYFTPEQRAEAYVFMSELEYDMCYDLGDFENYISTIGGVGIGDGFARRRAIHASDTCLLTTNGPHTDYFRKDSKHIAKSRRIRLINVPMDHSFTIFSDTSDYVLFNDTSDEEHPVSVLIKSKPIANSQRAVFGSLSQVHGN